MFAYEDAPYVIHTPEGRARRLGVVGEHLGGPTLYEIEEYLGTKVDAVSCYKSQIPVIFRFTSDFRLALTKHAQQTGIRVAAERFWPVIG